MRNQPLSKAHILQTLRANEAKLRQYSVKRIGLFGSYAQDRQKPESDIDFVVEFERPTYDNFYDLCLFLEQLFGRKVDVMTAMALETMRVPAVARNIRDSLVYA